MTFWSRPVRWLLLAACCLSWLGCNPALESGPGEERESHFVAGRRRAEQADYAGAVEAFEEALQNNPRSGAAHFELGLILYDKLNDPAGAIHHFQQFLKLQPGSNKADFARHYISVCKMELVKDVPFTSVNQQMQRELERLTRENNELRGQIDQLRVQLASRAPDASNPPSFARPSGAAPAGAGTGASPTMLAEVSPRGPTSPDPARSSALTQTYAVKSGDTPYSIARHFGIPTAALMAANPGLDPKRLKVGQTLNVPSR